MTDLNARSEINAVRGAAPGQSESHKSESHESESQESTSHERESQGERAPESRLGEDQAAFTSGARASSLEWRASASAACPLVSPIDRIAPCPTGKDCGKYDKHRPKSDCRTVPLEISCTGISSTTSRVYSF